MIELALTPTDGGLRLSVHVQPRASRTEVAGLHGTALKVRLHSPPVDGAANDELVSFLASELGIARRDVTIISGHSSRAKVVELKGVSAESVLALTNAEEKNSGARSRGGTR